MDNKLRIKTNVSERTVFEENRNKFNQFQYIKDIYACEKQLYILDERSRQLVGKLSNGRRTIDFKQSNEYSKYRNNMKRLEKYPSKVKEHKLDSAELFSGFFTGAFFGGIAGLVLTFITFIDGDIKTSALPILICAVLGAIIACLVAYKDERIKVDEYKKYIQDYTKVKAENDRIKSFNEKMYIEYEQRFNERKEKQIDEFEKGIGAYYKDEFMKIREQKKKVNETLELLYNIRINGILCLHPEYRGLVPISVIYGYFDTGRCTQLQGHEGAYNLYEDEKMKKMIIEKLDIIDNKLDNLNGTMIYVGQAIESCNDTLKELDRNSERLVSDLNRMGNSVSSKLNTLNEKTNTIIQNTANAAYYSEVSAKMNTFNATYSLLSD